MVHGRSGFGARYGAVERGSLEVDLVRRPIGDGDWHCRVSPTAQTSGVVVGSGSLRRTFGRLDWRRVQLLVTKQHVPGYRRCGI